MKKFKSLIDTSLIPISISIAIIGSMEVIYRVARGLHLNPSTFDTERLDWISIAHDGKHNKNEIFGMLRAKGFVDDLAYKPWIQIGNADHKNKYSIVDDGKRKTIDSPLKCKDPKLVWFFGGSTTYGTGVSWKQTIPSQFVYEASKNNICIKAINYAAPFHYSFQEAVNFIVKVSKNNNKLPSHVIFIDGLNDFVQPLSSIKKEPFFTPNFENYFSNNKKASFLASLDEPIIKFNLAFVDYLRYKILGANEISNYQSPPNLTTSEIAMKISSNFKENRTLISMVCSYYSIKCHQFIQPIPALYYKNNLNETLTGLRSEKQIKLFSIGYADILDNGTEVKYENLNIYDSSRIFYNYADGIPYVDSWHYSPRAINIFSKYIIENIFGAK